MYGQSEKLLYIGKAKNLRNRLFTYRTAKMGTTSRKTVRLIRMTHAIDIALCESEKEALLLENRLIRKYQPEFNHAKKQPETYYYISLQLLETELEFSLQMHIPEQKYVFGAFKGHRLVRKTLGGIIRILYILEHEIETPFQLPSVLIRNLTPMKYSLPLNSDGFIAESAWPLLLDYLNGEHIELAELFVEETQKRELLESFAGSMILDDLESMEWFYERCSHRNYQIRQQLELESPLIPQEKLDDYLIEWVFERDDD